MDIKNPTELLNSLNGITDEMLMDESFDIIGELYALARKRVEQTDAKLTVHEDRRNL